MRISREAFFDIVHLYEDDNLEYPLKDSFWDGLYNMLLEAEVTIILQIGYDHVEMLKRETRILAEYEKYKDNK